MPRLSDDRLMWEAYINRTKSIEDALLEEGIDYTTLTQEEFKDLLDEGLWDRLKARGAGLAGSVKGLGSRIGGTVKGAIAGATGDIAGVQAAQAQKQAAKAAPMDAKTLSIVNSHIKKIEGTIANLQNDLTKLGLDPAKMKATNPEAAAALQALTGAVNNLKSRLQPTGQVGKAIGSVGAAPAAPAPAAPAPAA